MRLPTNLTDTQRAALVDCIIIAARHGRALREQHERDLQKTESPCNLAGAGDSVETTGAALLPKDTTDAEK